MQMDPSMLGTRQPAAQASGERAVSPRAAVLSPAELRVRRRALSFSQEVLARRIGVAANTVARWERGEQRIGNPERVRAALVRLEREVRRRAKTRPQRVATPLHVVGGPNAARTRHNLPAPITGFVGRERELNDIQG